MSIVYRYVLRCLQQPRTKREDAGREYAILLGSAQCNLRTPNRKPYRRRQCVGNVVREECPGPVFRTIWGGHF